MNDESPFDSGASHPDGGGDTTHWSLVLSAGSRESGDSQAALEKLCQVYWPPLYGYVSRRVSQLDEAHDLIQVFFERLLDKGYLADANPDRGRFRAFLLTRQTLPVQGVGAAEGTKTGWSAGDFVRLPVL